MKLKVTVKELLELVIDAANYSSHDCKQYESSCYVCAVKRIKESEENDELEIEGLEYD